MKAMYPNFSYIFHTSNSSKRTVERDERIESDTLSGRYLMSWINMFILII